MRYPLLLVMLGAAAVGCTKTVKHDVAVFDLGPGKNYQPAPASGKYTVELAPPGERDFEKIPATALRVERGTVLGFENTSSGIVAFAGNTRISIDVPEGSTLKWQTTTKKHTQFATNLRRAGQYTLWGVGAVAALDGAVDEAEDRATGSKSSHRRQSRQYEPDDTGSSFFRDLYREAAADAAAESEGKKGLSGVRVRARAARKPSS